MLNASASGQTSASALEVAIAARASESSVEPHLATRTSMLLAKADLSTPSFLMASTMKDSSPIESFSNLDSSDIFSINKKPKLDEENARRKETSVRNAVSLQ